MNTIHTWNGEVYKKSSEAQYKLAYLMLKNYPLEGVQKVLDIGCGSGRISALIAEKVPHVTGVDASESMIEFAQKEYSNVKFVVADAQNLHLREEFDLITSFTALHWMPDHKAVWNSIKRQLKKDGKTLISFNPRPRHEALVKAIDLTSHKEPWKEFLKDYQEPEIVPMYTAEEYKKIITGEGLTIHRFDELWDYFEFSSIDKMVENMLGWFPHLSEIPQEFKQEYIENIVVRYLQGTDQNPKEAVKLYFRRFIIEASK
jgi:trans-aconitate 2-methyltransferase